MSGALDPANTFIGRHTLQGILGTAGSSVELGTEQMAILPNGDHGMSWMHADSTLASVTGQTGLLEQHFGANALAASVPAQVAADTAHPQHAIYRELMLEQRPALFEHVGSGNFAVHAAPGGGGGAAGAAEGGSALRASGGKGKLIGVGIGVIVAAAAAAAVLNGQRSASAAGVATTSKPADSSTGSAKAGASSSTAHAGDVSTTTHKVAGDDAKSQHGADKGAVTGGGAPSAQQQSVKGLRPGTVLQAGVDRTELSAKEPAARTTELTAVAARDPRSEAGKRAQIALRALGEAGRDIVATNADKSVSGAVGAYMAASGAAAAADRPWSGDFAAWASQPVHKLGFDGGGFRDLNDQINWMGNEDIIPMLRTDHVQEATSADESHGRDPALPKVGD
ncbi:MAG: hypothetical protein H7287_07035, partial [Thermoleophilia bacterium]|nr:hypothetical protein [Thermoleophilia bacterium]